MSKMSNLQVELEERGMTELDHAMYSYNEQMDLLRGLMNEAIDTSVDTSNKLYQ